jgi:ABC-type proline/glycine betaine transport system ATPase subunit
VQTGTGLDIVEQPADDYVAHHVAPVQADGRAGARRRNTRGA